MKLEVGMKVRIVDDLAATTVDDECGLADEMVALQGEVVTIGQVNRDETVYLEEYDWVWTPDCFVPI